MQLRKGPVVFFSSSSSRSRSGRFLEQLATLALSIVLAVIVWLIAINQEDPIVQGEFPDRIPVTLRGLAEGVQPLQELTGVSVRVQVTAPQSSWDDLDVADFAAYIDLTGLDEGVHDVDVTVEVVDPQVDIESVTRSEMRVQLDAVLEKEVAVRVDVLDSTAFGYDWRTPLVEPMTVTVSGPRTMVDQVTVAAAEVYLRNAKNQVERVLPVKAQNAQGQVVERITVSPPEVRIVVPVEEWPGRKEVAVRVSMEGQPAAGYRLTAVRANPSTVVLLGGAELLSQVPGFVETEPISLSEATGELQRRLSLIVPPDVRVLEGATVDVIVSITAIEGGATVRQKPVLQGVGPGLDASVALDTVEVILSGPLPLLESLGADDVFVILDLTGLLPGVHTVAPRVVAPEEIRAVGVLPEQVEVVIVEPAADEGTPGSEPAVPVETGTVTPAQTITQTSPLVTPEVAPPATETPQPPQTEATETVTPRATVATPEMFGIQTPASD